MNIEQGRKALEKINELDKWYEKREKLTEAIRLFNEYYSEKEPLKVWFASELEGHLNIRISTKAVELNGDELRVAVEAVFEMIMTRIVMLENDIKNL